MPRIKPGKLGEKCERYLCVMPTWSFFDAILPWFGLRTNCTLPFYSSKEVDCDSYTEVVVIIDSKLPRVMTLYQICEIASLCLFWTSSFWTLAPFESGPDNLTKRYLDSVTSRTSKTWTTANTSQCLFKKFIFCVPNFFSQLVHFFQFKNLKANIFLLLKLFREMTSSGGWSQTFPTEGGRVQYP